MSDPLKSSDRPGLGGASFCGESPDNDLLSEVLRDLRLAHASYGRSELTAPWGIAVPFREGVRFHALLDGQCWIQRNWDMRPMRHSAGHSSDLREYRREQSEIPAPRERNGVLNVSRALEVRQTVKYSSVSAIARSQPIDDHVQVQPVPGPVKRRARTEGGQG